MNLGLHAKGGPPETMSAEACEEERRRHIRALQALAANAYPNLSPMTRMSLMQRLRDELMRIEQRTNPER